MKKGRNQIICMYNLRWLHCQQNCFEFMNLRWPQLDYPRHLDPKVSFWPKIFPDWSLGSILWVPIASELLSKVTLDSGVQGFHAGSACGPFSGQCRSSLDNSDLLISRIAFSTHKTPYSLSSNISLKPRYLHLWPPISFPLSSSNTHPRWVQCIDSFGSII